MRRRLAVLVAAAMMLASMLAISSPASAQSGCQAFGTTVASEAQAFGGIGEEVSGFAPANNEVHFFHGVLCS